jgi:DNA sulfur modification protein DndD
MWIERIRIRDWKCFIDATVDLPPPTSSKPVVLIGAQNGAGKTSLLEAVLFCLYGPLAIELVAEREAGMQRGSEGFRRFVGRAVNDTARSQGRTRASVEVVFADDDERISIERRFHIQSNGNYRDQEVFIKRGRAADPADEMDLVHVPPLLDRDDFLRGFVAQHVLPHNLAPFFFFDGEQVQRLAAKDRSDVTKRGLEQLFGVMILRTLQRDLRELAKARRSKGRVGTNPAKLAQVEADISKAEAALASLAEERQTLEDAVPSLTRKVDALQSEFTVLVSGNVSNIDEINRELVRAEEERKAALRELNEQVLGRDLGLALAASVGVNLDDQLERETKRDSFEAARVNMMGKLAKLLNEFETLSEPEIAPPLTSTQLSAVRRRIQKAYEGMFVPPPDDIAREVRHAYLGTDNREVVRQRIRAVRGLSLARIRDVLGRMEGATARARDFRERQQALAEGTRAAELAKELSEAQAALTQASDRLHQVKNNVAAETSNLGNLRQEQARLTTAAGKGEHENNVAARCDGIANMLDGFIEELRKKKTEQLSTMMTHVYRQLARKEDVVKRIEIDGDGPVRLVGTSGRNLADRDLSAGENEIFALSLLYAASKLSSSDTPVIIDTPVARLDRNHRVNIAKNYLPNAAGQVILLSTDTELVGDYLAPLRGRVGAAFLIDFNSALEISTVRPGYFEKVD